MPIDPNAINKVLSNPEITTPQIDNTNNTLSNALVQGVSSQSQYVGNLFPSDSKFDYGITTENLPNLNQIRASRQPWYEQAGAMINQAVIGSVIGQTIEGLGAILEIPEMIKNTITEEDDDFHNFLYNSGKGLTDWAEKITPIYQNGKRFGDWGWWFQGGVSVASFISMLIPMMGAAKVGRGIAKGLKLSTTAADMLETGIGATMGRHVEGFMEAANIYDETLQNGLQAKQQGLIDKSDDEIKHIASKAAALNYNINWANIGFDLIQMGAILRPLRGLTRNLGFLDYDVAKAAGKLPTSKLGKIAYWMAEPGKGLLEESSQGLEEVVNQIAQYEGERQGNIDLGITPDDNTTFTKRLGDYLKRPDTVDAFIWGTIGGLMFKPFAKAIGMDKSSKEVDRKLSEIAGREQTLKNYAKYINAIYNNEVIKDNDGNIVQDFSKTSNVDKLHFANKLKKKLGFNLGLNASVARNVDLLIDKLNDPKEQQKLIDLKISTPETIHSDVKTIKDEVERAERLYTKHFERLYETPIEADVKRRIINTAVNTDYNRESNLNTIKDLEKEYVKLHNEDPYIQQNIDNPAVENTIRQSGIGIALATLKNNLVEAKENKNIYAVEKINKIIPNLESKLENLKETEIIDPKLLDFRLVQNVAQQEMLKEYNNLLSEDLSKIDSKENIKKVQEDVKNENKIIQDAISKNVKEKTVQRKEERLADEKNIIDEFENTQQPIKETISKESVEDIIQKPKEEINWDKLINNAVNEKELDAIVDQMDKAKVPVDFSKINTKRESLKTQESVQPEISTQPEQQQEPIQEENKLEEYQKTPIQDIINENTINKLKDEQFSEEITKNLSDNEHIDDNKYQDILNSSIKIQEDLKKDNGTKTQEDGTIIYDNSKIDNGYNALGYLHRKYERTKVGNKVSYKSSSDELVEGNTKEIASPYKFNVGEKVTLKVADNDDIEIYDPRKEGKELITWGNYKTWLKEQNPNVNIETLDEYKNNIPIRIVYNGKEYDAFLHNASWINEENISGNINENLDNLKKIRNYIIDEGEFTTVINDKTNGTLFDLTENKQITLKESVGEDLNYVIGVGTSDGIRLGKGKLFEGNLINKEYIEGSTYLIVKTSNGNDIAIPVTKNKIGNVSNPILNTVTTAINIYLDNDVNHPLRMAILDSKKNGTTGDDITTIKGISNFLENLVHSYDTKSTDLDDLVRTKSISTKSDSRYFSIHHGVFFLFDGTTTGRTLSLSKEAQKYRNMFMDALEEVLPKFYLNTKASTIDEDKRIPFINEQGEIEFKNYKELTLENSFTNIKGNKVDEINGKSIYSYTVQPVVRFDFSNIIGLNKKEEVISPIDKPINISEDYDDILKNFELYGNESFLPGISEFKSKYLIQELGVYNQEVITNHVFRNIVKDIIENPEEDKNIIRNRNLSNFKNKLNEYKQKYSSEEYKDNPTAQQFLNKIVNPSLDNFEILSRLINIKIQKVNNLVGNVNDEIDLENIESENNEKLFNDKSSYEEKLSLSAEIKRLFATLNDTRKNFLGEYNVVDYQTVNNAVMGILESIEPDFDIMIKELEKYKDTHSWMPQLINNLTNSPKSIQNKFVTEMNHHYVEHIKTMWALEGKGNKKEFNINIQVENASSVKDQLIDNWKSNLVESKFIDDNHKLVNFEELKSKYQELKKDKDLIKAREWLESLGIKITDNLWNVILSDKYTYQGKTVNKEWFINSNSSPINILYKQLDKIGSNSIDDIDIFSQGALSKLAHEDSKYRNNVYAFSHRSGNKTVYSYGKNKFLNDWDRELANSNTSTKLLNSPFHSTSILLKAFDEKSKTGNDNTITSNYMSPVAAVSLQSLKKHGAKDKEGMELYNLGDDEYEMQQIGTILSSLPDKFNGTARIIIPNFLTTSDKSTAFMKRWAAVKIGFDINGNLDDSSIDMIYTQCVLPEIRRIKQWENIKNTGQEFDNNKFAIGGHMFHMFPSINNIEGIWNSDGSINIDVESIEFRKHISNEIRKTFENLVNSKLENWKKYNFIEENKETGELIPLTIPFKTLDSFGILEGVTKENYVKVAASDMVYQYLIFNANMYTGVIGDPAKEFKSGTYERTVREFINNGTITDAQSNDVAYVWSKFTPEQRIKTIQNVFDNIGKRLAGPIAPRKQIANTLSSKINYLLVNDKAVDSKSLDQYKVLLSEKDVKEYSKSGILEEGTNAQEFTTFMEHLSNMENAGLLPDGFYDKVNNIVTKEIKKENYYYTENIRNGLDEKNRKFFDKDLVMQVTKPVYYWNEISSDNTGITQMYIKSSAYPLLPELTVGNEIDKIRILMESKGIDRLSFNSATKLGMPSNPINLWDVDGNVRNDITDEEIRNSSKLLDRKGFGFQQEVPYEKLKDFISRVSQADKNLFTNILHINDFSYNNKKWNGTELREEYGKIYDKLYEIGYQDLVNEINIQFDEDGNVTSFDRNKLKKILSEEAIKRDYSLNDIDGLDLDEALDFIAFMPSANKYEALLNSIVKNRVLKIDFRGKSFVLSTEEGYQQDKSKSYEELTSKEKSGIVYTSNWNGELDPGHFEDKNGKKLTGKELEEAWKNGNVVVKKPAQCLIPWKFKYFNTETKQNEILDITKFIGEDGKIDNSKLPSELLQILGMRIPNQGHNSQSWIEIVGFLPKMSGDIIVAPRDFLAQMGSDFDVDKLYTYMYNYQYNKKTGKLNKFKSKNITSEDIVKGKERTSDRTINDFLSQLLGNEYENVINDEVSRIEKIKRLQQKQDLQNKVLDIHLAIQSNSNPLIQSQIYEPLGFWNFKDIADEITNAQPVNLNFTPLSDSYQKTKRLNAAMGKTLVGDFANGSMFISAVQGKDVQLLTTGYEPKPFYVRFGDVLSNGDLSNPFTLKCETKIINSISEKEGIKKNIVKQNLSNYIPKLLNYIDLKDIEYRSQVMSGLLSLAVDNEKEQGLDKLYLNSRTSKFAKMLVLLGFGREVAYFTRQPIIMDYFNEIKRLRSSLGNYNQNASKQAEVFVRNKYTPKDFDSKYYDDNFSKGKGLSIDNLKNSIINPDTNFNYIQLSALEQLLYLEPYANKLQIVQSTINTDSKGLDKSLLETISKEDIFNNLQNLPIKNITNILDNSIWGSATEKGLIFNNKLWSNIFPYRQQGIQYMFDKIEELVGKDEVSSQTKASLRNSVWNNFKSYIYTIQDLGLYNANIEEERKRLLTGKDNLAVVINNMKNSDEWKNHPFISRLNPDLRKNLPSRIFMNASLDQVGEVLVMQSVLDLYINDRPITGTNYTTKELFKDLVAASYINGGIQEAVQYLRFMPISYLFDSGMGGKIQDMVKNKSFEDTDFLNIANETMPYWVIPNFITQYVQHNTKGLVRLEKKTPETKGYFKQIRTLLSDDNLSTNVKVTKFALTDNNIKVKRTIDGEQKNVFPEFLVIPDDGRKNKLLDKDVIFTHKGEFTNDGYPIYYRISNKGIFGMNEYVFSKETINSNSIIDNYNTSNTINEEVIKFPKEIQGSSTFTNPASKITNTELLEIKSKGNSKDLKKIIDNIIIHSDDKFSQILAKEMSLNFDKLKDIKYDSNFNMEGIAGSYDNANNEVKLNLNNPLNSTLEGLSETILHEVQHGFVNTQIKLYLVNSNLVNSEVRSAIADMKRLQSIFKSKVKEELEIEEYNKNLEIIKNLESIKNREYSRISDRDNLLLVYAAEKLTEFSTLSMKNKYIQRKLNNINDPERAERGLLDRFIDIVKKLLNSIGFNVDKNSLLAGAIENNLVLISNKNENIQENSTESLLPGIPSQQEILKQFNQLNENGTKKKKLVTDSSYKQMLKIAQKINQEQSFYKASIGMTIGEEVSVRSGRQYYIITLTPKEVSTLDRYNSISDKDIIDRIRKCR